MLLLFLHLGKRADQTGASLTQVQRELNPWNINTFFVSPPFVRGYGAKVKRKERQYMNNLTERYEKERQMRLDCKIRYLQIKRLENQMANEFDPFGPEFEEAARKLRELMAEQHAAGLQIQRYHSKTFDMEREADAVRRDEKKAQRAAAYLAEHPRLSSEGYDRLYKNQPEI